MCSFSKLRTQNVQLPFNAILSIMTLFSDIGTRIMPLSA